MPRIPFGLTAFVRKVTPAVLLAAAASLVLAGLQVTPARAVCDPNAVATKVSVSSNGTAGNASPQFSSMSHLSADGRYVAYDTTATNLVSGDTNGQQDVFVYDRQNCTTTRASVRPDGTQWDNNSLLVDISPDGHYILFNTVVVPHLNQSAVMMYDQQSGSSTQPFPQYASDAAFSRNGHYIVFTAAADPANGTDMFVYDFQNGQTTPVPLVAAGSAPSRPTFDPRITDDGRYIYFSSDQLYTSGGINGFSNVFRKDRQSGSLELVTGDAGGNPLTGSGASISADGNVVAFQSEGAFEATDTNDDYDLYVRDWQQGTVTRISVDSNGGELNSTRLGPVISADGRWVTFEGVGFSSMGEKVFLHDNLTRQTVMYHDLMCCSSNRTFLSPMLSGDGNFISFLSDADDIVPNDPSISDYFEVSTQAVFEAFVVNSPNDVNDGACNANHCSLREAILAANASTATDTGINFVIPGSGVQTIQPTSPLPTLTHKVTISGRSQPGYINAPLIEVDGSLAGVQADGLTLTADHSEVYGLAINGFGGSGLHLMSSFNIVESNFFGIDPDGLTAQGNGRGILIEGHDNQIGYLGASNRNIISGNGDGVVISGAQATQNQLYNNYIGTDINGTSAVGNTSSGVTIDNAHDNIVGRVANVISGNLNGVVIRGTGAKTNDVVSNLIGTDASGTLPLGNSDVGVLVTDGAARNEIGTTSFGEGNVIAYNGTGVVFQNGSLENWVQSDSVHSNLGNGVTVLDTSQDNRIFSTIFANGGLGVDLGGDGVTPNDVDDADEGPNHLTNTPIITKVVIDPSGNVSIRGTFNGLPTTDVGVSFYVNDTCDPSGYGEGQIALASSPGTALMRTDNNGDLAFAASASGITAGQSITALAFYRIVTPISGMSEFSACMQPVPGQLGPIYTVNNDGDRGISCQIDSCSLREAILAANEDPSVNIIRFNIPAPGQHTITPGSPLPILTGSVTVDGTSQPGFAGKPIIELSGAQAGANADGLSLLNAKDSLIKGLVINRFGGHGIVVSGGAATIRGNYIGTDTSGTTALANGSGGTNQGGIQILSMTQNVSVIGGDNTADQNVISGNNPNGVVVTGSSSAIVTNNLIGLNAAGNAALPNVTGVRVDGNNNTVGSYSTTYRKGNLISGNSGTGLLIAGDSNAVQANFIGTNADAALHLGNGGAGMDITGNKNFIGSFSGLEEPEMNVIAYNQGAGIAVREAGHSANQNRIDANRIFANGGLGIDLGNNGITPNDVNDSDNGPNHLLNFPTFSQSQFSTNGFTLKGELRTAPSQLVWIYFYLNTSCDPSGNGEGEYLLGQISGNTDETGLMTFSQSYFTNTAHGLFVSASAIVTNGDTSEFSRCVQITFPSAANAAPVRNYGHAPLLTWSPVNGAIGYQVQIASDLTFQNLIFDDAHITTKLFAQSPPLTYGVVYYWRVRAKIDSLHWGAWSRAETLYGAP